MTHQHPPAFLAGPGGVAEPHAPAGSEGRPRALSAPNAEHLAPRGHQVNHQAEQWCPDAAAAAYEATPAALLCHTQRL
ncbi:hypothetical protein [Catellatospora coxensis]|uniref:Uncharacterized protein n=1 Tax=Catellatospora coxensis TaxID=310354 RepID=A0A8J3P708_9ACTN|nr:hypothetical protein [Catellatospora coxensis]GIG04091.1 hypothetical protein Cco03nite_07910 [Catellatospora coxensis]